MEQTIPFVENLGEELVRAIGRQPRRRVMTRRSLLLVAVGVLLAMAPAAAIVAQTVFGPTPGQLEVERGGELIPGSLQILRSVEGPGGTIWTVVTYETTKYECLDVYGGIMGSPEPAGSVGGCGGRQLAPGDPIDIETGGALAVGAELYSVVGGRVSAQVAMVHATFSDGTTDVDHPVGGVWLFAGPANRHLTEGEAVDEDGHVIGRVGGPSRSE